jgi:hypothetical protein
MAQEGFLYEENAYEALQKHKISTGGVAGASHDKPDLTIQKGKNKSGCELKISPTAAGSLVMKYTKGKWDFGEYKGDPEKEFMVALANKVGLLKEMNTSGSHGSRWRGKVPSLQNDAAGKKILAPGVKDKATAYKLDIAKFGATNEVHINVPAKAVCDYYNAKKCYYINVGTHGFFLLNKSDPLDLNGQLEKMKMQSIKDFGNSASCKIRVRCQLKSSASSDYQFVMTLQFSNVTKSLYNIAPLINGSKSTIDKNKLSKDPLLLAFK